MKNASGHHRDENRWPLPVLAAPRGLREITWHVVALLTLGAPLVLRGGWYVLAAASVTTWFLKLNSPVLRRVALWYLAAGLVIAAIFATPLDFPIAIAHDFDWSRAPEIGASLTFALDVLFDLSVAVCSVATLLAFDRRSVNRAAVDLRVWQRQQVRRRQLLRGWHRVNSLPEVIQ
jgi:hypothetical protein